MRLAVLPQVLPVMLSHVHYYFESNTRSATILGIVGAGVQLSERIQINNWDQVLFILILILILLTVMAIDTASGRLRSSIIKNPEHCP